MVVLKDFDKRVSNSERRMSNLELRVLEDVSALLGKGKINSFAVVDGETMLVGASSNYKGLLIRERQVLLESTFNTSFLKQEVQYLQNHVLIVSFVENMPKLHIDWL